MRLGIPLALAWLASSAFAGIRYVDAALVTGANDGSSWTNAFQGPIGLQAALAGAQPGDQVWCAEGTYKPTLGTTRTFSFVLLSGVELYGGFAGGEAQLDERDPGAHPAVLDGDLNGDDASNQFGDNSLHVVYAGSADPTAVLDGFTVRGGNANVTGFNQDRGGGLLCSGGSNPTVRGCILRENRAVYGGGIALENATIRLLDTRLEANHSTNSGGGLYANIPLPDLPVTRCTFVSNSSASGGGAHTIGGTNVEFRECLFRDNTATVGSGGGALYVNGSLGLIHCTVVRNRTFTAVGSGGIQSIGIVGLLGSIVYFNQGPGGSMGLADNVSANVSGAWSCVQGGLGGLGMLAVDPQFVNLAASDFHLSSTSPCCDAGNNAQVSAGLLTDLGGEPRFVDNPSVPDTGSGAAPIVDMGAYETPNTLYVPFCFGDGSQPTPCPCGNAGIAGHGCAASDFFSVGAAMTASGVTAPDTLVLSCTEMLDSVSCIFLQGDQQNTSGVVFGDGVRCVAGALKRLYVKTASAGGTSVPGAGDPSISARSAALGDPITPGSQRYYQVYYRDPDLTFCPAPQGNTWNVTSGVIVAW